MRREVSHLVMKLKWIFIKVQYNIYFCILKIFFYIILNKKYFKNQLVWCYSFFSGQWLPWARKCPKKTVVVV